MSGSLVPDEGHRLKGFPEAENRNEVITDRPARGGIVSKVLGPCALAVEKPPVLAGFVLPDPPENRGEDKRDDAKAVE